MNPEQNAVTEGINRTIAGKASCMLHHAKQQTFRAEVVNIAAFLRNQKMHPKNAVNKKTPFEHWYNIKASVSNLKVFGYIANVHQAHKNHCKFDETSKKAIFVVYQEGSKCYKLFYLETKHFTSQLGCF